MQRTELICDYLSKHTEQEKTLGEWVHELRPVLPKKKILTNRKLGFVIKIIKSKKLLRVKKKTRPIRYMFYVSS
jgi:hypothetical protein